MAIQTDVPECNTHSEQRMCVDDRTLGFKVVVRTENLDQYLRVRLALREFSRNIRKAIRACDTPVRLGGDEFLLILPDCPRDKAGVILQRIGTSTIECNREKIHVCYSTGCAQFEFGDTSETILTRADEVLYVKKAAREASLVSKSVPTRRDAEVSITKARIAGSNWRKV